MDIIARWRDAINDPPPDGYYQLSGDAKHGLWCSYLGGRWTDDSSMMPVDIDPGDQWLDVTDVPAVAVSKVQAELETERMRLIACSVAALSNTRESAKEAREIPDEYKSASWHDVCSAVDREMDLRESTDAILRAQVQAAVDEINMEMKGPEDEWPIRILNYHTGLLPTERE